MADITLADKLVRAYQNNEPMPLKGHTKITLTDIYTGEQKIVEEDNMVTNAVASVLAHNYSGLANFSSIMPLKNMYSGVMCFESAITENADNFNPPAENINKMVACAGQTPHATANPYRGNPNGGQSHTDATSIKFVWDWASNQGNGTISTVCLCPDYLGNMGLKPFDDTMMPLTVFGEGAHYSSNAWDVDIARRYPFSIDAGGASSKTLWCENGSTTMTEYTTKHDYSAFGFLRGSEDWVALSSRTATIRDKAGSSNNRFVVDDTDYYYVISATASALQIDKVSKSNMTVTSADITYSGVSLYTGEVNNGFALHVLPFDGTYLYFPNSDRTQFYRLNITQSSDVTLLDGTVTIETGVMRSNTDGYQFMTPIVISQNLVLGSNYLINGDTVYPMAHVAGKGIAWQYFGFAGYLDVIRQGTACFGNAKQRSDASSSQRWYCQTNLLCHLFLSTINVLQESVVKAPSQTMTIEYTITEV